MIKINVTAELGAKNSAGGLLKLDNNDGRGVTVEVYANEIRHEKLYGTDRYVAYVIVDRDELQQFVDATRPIKREG